MVRPRFRSALLVALVALVAVASPRSVQAQPKTARILVLEGAPGERGRMHGQLLAKEILEAAGELEKLRDDIVPGGTKAYLQLLEKFTFEPDVEAEMDGIADGVRDTLGENVTVPGTNRPFGRDEVVGLNTLCDLLPFACSSFSVTGPAVEGGKGTLTGRNLDYKPFGSVLKHHLILVETPRKGRHAWSTLTWPGLVGCYTGMNDEGVTASIHDVPTGADHLKRGGDLTPRAIGLRKVLEMTGKGDKLGARAAEVLRACKVVYGTNVHVSGPGGAMAILEWDPQRGTDNGVAVREADQGEPLVCTNHFRVRAKSQDCERFDALTKALTDVKGLTAAKALEVLRVAAVRTPENVTVHSVVFSCEARKLLAAFAPDPTHAACDGPGETIDLGAIFDHPESVPAWKAAPAPEAPRTGRRWL